MGFFWLAGPKQAARLYLHTDQGGCYRKAEDTPPPLGGGEVRFTVQQLADSQPVVFHLAPGPTITLLHLLHLLRVKVGSVEEERLGGGVASPAQLAQRAFFCSM